MEHQAGIYTAELQELNFLIHFLKHRITKKRDQFDSFFRSYAIHLFPLVPMNAIYNEELFQFFLKVHQFVGSEHAVFHGAKMLIFDGICLIGLVQQTKFPSIRYS